MKKKVILGLLIIILVCAGYFGYPYIERHYITATTDIELEEVNEDSDILIAYFTRLDNMEEDKDVDAVSGASLMKDSQGNLIGNTQAIATNIQKVTHGHLYSITTDKKYSSSYDTNTQQAREEMEKDELPILSTQINNMDQYKTIYLVYPLWWGTFPQPVKSFLKSYDFSEKTIIPVASQGSSGFGSSIEDMKKNTNATIDENGISIYCADASDCYDEIKTWLDGRQ